MVTNFTSKRRLPSKMMPGVAAESRIKITSLPGRWATGYLISTAVLAILLSSGEKRWTVAIGAIYGIFVWICFYFGQRVALRNFVLGSRPVDISEKGARILIALVGGYAAVLLLALLYDYGVLYKIPTVLQRIASPGTAYFEKIDAQLAGDEMVSVIGQIYTITSATVAVTMCAGMRLWSKLSGSRRALVLTVCLLYMLPGLVSGTMVDIGMVIVYSIIAWMFYSSVGAIAENTQRRLRRLVILLCLAFTVFSVRGQIDRAVATGWNPWVDGDGGRYNTNNILAYTLGDKVGFGVHSMIGYVAHGYEGLGECLELPFKWTYGIGSSRALMEYAEQYLGWNWIWDRHLLWRNQAVTGRHPGVYWSTALPWFASDVSFFGVPFIIFGIGWLFGRTWIEAVTQRRLSSYLMFNQLCIMVLFLPCNNQIVQGRTRLWTTVVVVCIYVVATLRFGRRADPCNRTVRKRAFMQ